ncbi:MAG TPA: hypothetical protein VFX16_37165 [Pseudonocardiaceae bacterium]|nr:hypothetical protein [Pseudonocardiaceae bacterium]
MILNSSENERDDEAVRHEDWEAQALMLETSGDAARAAGNFRQAEIELRQAWSVRHYRLTDEPGELRVLYLLAATFEEGNRLHRAMDALDAIHTRLQRDPADAVGLAAVNVDIGLMYVKANRSAEDSVYYFKRAIQIYQLLAQPAPVGHARALVAWGRVLWNEGSVTAARNRFKTALTLVTEAGNRRLATRIQALVVHPKDQPMAAWESIDGRP